MAKYPVFLDLSSRRAVVIGGGAVAVRKARSLLEAGARLVVVADKFTDVMTDLCATPKAELIRSKYSKQYLAGAVLVIAATNDRPLNEQIYKDCQQLEILCNVVDDPDLCDFFVPAVVKRGHLQIAIGTDGNCPAYAGHVRKKLEKVFTESHGEFLAELEAARQRIIVDVANPALRKSILGELVHDESFAYFTKNGPVAWRDRAAQIIRGRSSGR